MKRICLLLVVCAALAFGEAETPNDVEALRVENAKLRLEVKKLEREVADLRVQLDADDPETVEIERPKDEPAALRQLIIELITPKKGMTAIQREAWLAGWTGREVKGRLRIGEVRNNPDGKGLQLVASVKLPKRPGHADKPLTIILETEDTQAQSIQKREIIEFRATVVSIEKRPIVLSLTEWK